MEDLIAPLPPYLFATTLHCHFLCASHFQRSNTTVTAGVCIFGIADVPFPFRAAALKTGRKPACLSLIIQYSMENRKQGHHMVGGAAEITRVLGPVAMRENTLAWRDAHHGVPMAGKSRGSCQHVGYCFFATKSMKQSKYQVIKVWSKKVQLSTSMST